MHMDEVLLLGMTRVVMVRFVRVGILLLVDQLLTPLISEVPRAYLTILLFLVVSTSSACLLRSP